MGKRKSDVRLGSKVLFIYYHKVLAVDSPNIIVNACTNKRILSKKTGIDYNTLMWNFTRKNKCFYENENTIILKLYTSVIEKGNQSITRKGKGGMEKFMEKYAIKKREEY